MRHALEYTRVDFKSMGEDVLWADNNLQAQVDFGYRTAH